MFSNYEYILTYTLPTSDGGEASHRPLPARRGFWGTFCYWQQLVATKLSSDQLQSLANKFLEIFGIYPHLLVVVNGVRPFTTAYHQQVWGGY